MRKLHAAFALLCCGSLLSCTSAPSPKPVAAALPLPVTHVPPLVPATLQTPLQQRLLLAAPDIDPGILALALEARQCALRQGSGHPDDRHLAVIDYTLPSSRKRLWLFDLQQARLVHHEYVTHGQGSGELLARRFSNVEGSLQTSLGLYRTAETYFGANGYSLRLDGLDRGFNDAARSRAIVIHGAWYADPALIARQGRLGRSQGCPALRHEVAGQIIDTLKEGQWVFAYADHAPWLEDSSHFGCSGRNARQIIAQARTRQGGIAPLQELAEH